MIPKNINPQSPLALIHAPQAGELSHLMPDIHGKEFQILTVDSLTELAEHSLQMAQNLCVCIVDLTISGVSFEDCYNAIDINFRSAGGPIIAVVNTLDDEQEEALLSLGVAKVVDISLGAKALQLIFAVEVRGFHRIVKLRREMVRRSSAIGQIVEGVFKFKTRREAQNLATMLSMTCPNPMPIAVGLAELLINGVEHGCLEIGHDEKGTLIEGGALAAEVRRRRALPEYADRFVTVEFQREPNRLCFLIKDGGSGFDYQHYILATDGHTKKHGRGIMMAKACFETLEYQGNGSEVRAVHSFGNE